MLLRLYRLGLVYEAGDMMQFIQQTGQVIRRSPPFMISLFFHLALLTVFAYITWDVPSPSRAVEAQTAAIMLQESRQGLRFADTSQLERFKFEDKTTYPLAQSEPRPAMPQVKFVPEMKVREDINLLGVPVLDRSWAKVSNGPLAVYTGAERLSGSFSRHVQGMRDMGLDIVFIFDATSSMAGFLRQVKYKIANLVTTFKALVPTARVGLVAYRDTGDDFVTKTQQLTYSTQSLQDFLRDIAPVGGGDREEALDEALRVAVEQLNWKGKSKKIIVIIGDAPPHRQDMPKARALAEKFKKRMDGLVAALDTSPQTLYDMDGRQQTKVLDEFRLLAEAGGGESARLLDEEKVIRQMAILVFGTKWEMCLDEFLKNL
jgi:Mg-chelatase subunit ChlD